MTATAYSYLRFSSPQQAAGDSLRRQTESTAAWCTRSNVALDTSIRMTDLGVSAFKGKHRKAENADTHALAAFLQAVKTGRIQEGSFLILESLDRLTREDIVPAVNLFTSILMSGIRIVQLHPNEHVYDQKADMTHIMLALLELSRGNSESKMKSERVGAAWKRKQKEAGTKIVTKKLPGWIAEKGGKLVLNGHADTVRRIFALALEGHGARGIALTMNAGKVPVMGRATMKGRAVKWSNTTVYYVLTSRSTIGEYLPNKEAERPGEPVAGYFPPVITESTFHAAQSAIKTRGAVGKGRKGTHVNLLAGLLKDARDGGALTYWRQAGRPPVVIPVAAKSGHGGLWTSFPAPALDEAILCGLAEVTVSDVTGEDSDATQRVKRLGGEIAETEALVRAWSAKMDNPDIVDVVAAKLGELNAKLRKLIEDRNEAQREAANPVAETLGEILTLSGLMKTDGSDEMKLKVRSAIRRVVSEITVLIIPAGKSGPSRIRRAAVRVQFAGTDRHRDYLILHRSPRTEVRTFADAAPGGMDLRNPDHAADVERALLKLEL